MKKLIYIASALTYALFGKAMADVSVSGSASFAYTDAGGNAESIHGGGVSFALSTVTDAGVSISGSAGISLDGDSVNNASGSTGVTSLTFGFANGSITIADDLGVSDGVGKVGELAGYADDGLNGVSFTTGIGDDEGNGISATTSVGDMSLKIAYVWDGKQEGNVDGSATTAQSALLTMPIGDMSLSLAAVSDDVAGVNMTESAGALTLPVGAGSLSVGITGTSGDTPGKKGESYSAAYKTSMGSVNVGIGYTAHDVNSKKGQQTDVTLSTSLGGGASLWAEYTSTSGTTTADTASTANSVIAVGTSVSF
jgi:hypothetical protein